jgi:uncharacterized protein YaaN involved in tellurite resistance
MPTSHEPSGDPQALSLTAPTVSPSGPADGLGQEIGVPPEIASRIDAIVEDFLDAVVRLDPHEAEFGRRIAEVQAIAEREIFATSEMSRRVLDQPVRAITGILGAKAPIAQGLLELRRGVEDLDPARQDLDAVKDWERYEERFAAGQTRLQEIIWALTDSRNRLLADNAALAQDQRALWTEMETLRQYAYLVRSLDEGLERRIDGLAGTDASRAKLLREDVLFPVRQRLQDIVTQLAVATQGYAALHIVEQTNAEVIRAIGSATTTTAAALRTAIMVTQAIAVGRLIRDELASVDATLPPAGPATGSGANVASLHAAWDKVLGTLDEIDAYTAAARLSMQVTVRELAGQVERSRALAGGAAGPGLEDGSSLRIQRGSGD